MASEEVVCEGEVWEAQEVVVRDEAGGERLEQDYYEKLGAVGMAKGVSASTVFQGVERGIGCVLHGDDFPRVWVVRRMSTRRWRF